MNDNQEIIKLRLERSLVSRYFPFDICYFVPIDLKKYIPKLFPWSLCIPVTDQVTQTFSNIRWSIKHMYPCLNHTTSERPQYLTKEEKQRFWGYFTNPINLETYFIVVPILPVWSTVYSRHGTYSDEDIAVRTRQLGYITAPKHEYGTDNRFTGMLTDDVVLFTPKGPIRPVCKICPNSLKHLRNECRLGCKLCRKSLLFIRSANEQLPDNADRPVASANTTA